MCAEFFYIHICPKDKCLKRTRRYEVGIYSITFKISLEREEVRRER